MKNDRTNLVLLTALLGVMLIFPYFPFRTGSQTNTQTEVVETASFVDTLYDKAETEGYYKADILSYNDDGFNIVVVKDEGKSYGTVSIITKTKAGFHHIIQTNTNNMTINIMTENKVPYAEMKFSSGNSTKNLTSVTLYLPSEYGIDTYSPEDSIHYEITEYSLEGTQ